METETITLLLVLFLLVIVCFGFYLTFMALGNIQTQLTGMRRLNHLRHDDIMGRLKLLSISELTALRDYCIDNERYEDARILTNMLNRDYEECFPKEEQPTKGTPT